MENEIRKMHINSTVHFLLSAAQALGSSITYDGKIEEQWFSIAMNSFDIAKDYAKKACGAE